MTQNRYGAIALTLAVVYAVGATYFAFRPHPAPPGIHMPATPAPELKRETTAPLIIDFVQAYPPAAKKKLDMPAHVQADPNQHVVASTKTANDGRQHTITTVLDTTTRGFTTHDRVDPLPWLAVSTRRHYGAYIGAMNGEQAVVLTARQEALQIKGLKVEAVAIAGLSQAERFTFVGVGASW